LILSERKGIDMLVRVNPDYSGTYGLFNESTKSTIIKTKESAPFNMDDALSLRMIKKGVLVRVNNPESLGEIKEPVKEPEKDPAVISVNTHTGDVLEDMTLKELKAIAKEQGVTFKIGMSKARLIDAIREAENEEPPILTAAEPE
jgi:hypothetical protein